MATHSNVLAWRSSWTEEPSGLQSTGSQRVGQNSATNTSFLIVLSAVHRIMPDTHLESKEIYAVRECLVEHLCVHSRVL